MIALDPSGQWPEIKVTTLSGPGALVLYEKACSPGHYQIMKNIFERGTNVSCLEFNARRIKHFVHGAFSISNRDLHFFCSNKRFYQSIPDVSLPDEISFSGWIRFDKNS